MSTIPSAWALEYSLTQADIFRMFIFSAVFLNFFALTTYAVIGGASKKKYAWSISLLNSFLMSIVGIIYVYIKVSNQPNAFVFGADGPTLFYGADNASVLICIWFAIANVADLLYGLLFYREYLGVITTYLHHSVFIWMMYYAPTGNGIFVSSTPFAPAFTIMLVEEIPTFLLALGSVFPSYRTDLGFGVTFFLLRICYHFYFTAYSIVARVSSSVIVLYLLTLALHVNWFYSWVTKYGRKSLGRGAKTATPIDKKED